MNFFGQLLINEPLLASFWGWFLAQSIKVILNLKRDKKFDFRWFAIPGGFPSSHTAAVVALLTSLGINFGLDSGMFAIASVIAAIVIYDANVIRGAAGKQAEALNKIFDNLLEDKEIETKKLKEILGHSGIEIFSGALIGIFIGILMDIL